MGHPAPTRQITDAGIEGIGLMQRFFKDNTSPPKHHYHASLLTGISHSARN